MEEILNNIRSLISSKNFEKADATLLENINKFPEKKELIKLKAELKLRLGEFLWEQGEIESALDNFKEALELDLENKEIILRCGNILSELDFPELSRKLYESYIEKHPEDIDVKNELDKLNEVSNVYIEPEDEQKEIIVSAIVSTYNSEKFIQGCIEDLINQSLYKQDKLEIIIIDSGSQQNEKLIVERFQKQYKNIKYLRTEERETIYAAWNRGIKIARGKYITNANTDDRHRYDALEVLSRVLDEKPEIKLVYGDCYLSLVPNQTFENNPKNRIYRYPDYLAPSSLLHFQFGPQPMWRKEIHNTLGYFNETFKAAGDFDFNIRFAMNFKAFHISEILGTYLMHDNAASFRDNIAVIEAHKIHAQYRTKENILALYKLEGIPCNTPEEQAIILVDIGIRAMEFYPPWEEGRLSSDFDFAIKCFKWASDLNPSMPSALNNLGATLYLCGNTNEALKIFEDIRSKIDNDIIEENLKIIYSSSNSLLPAIKIISSGLSLPSQKELVKKDIQENIEKVSDTIKSTSTQEYACKTSISIEKKKYKVIFVVHSFPTQNMAGTELYTFNLAKELHSMGVQAIILYPEFDTQKAFGTVSTEVIDEITIAKMNINHSKIISEQFMNEKIGIKFKDYILNSKPDIVHFNHFIGFTISSLNECVKTGIPSIVSLQDEWILCEQLFYLQNGVNFCIDGPENSEKCARCFVTRYQDMNSPEIFDKIINIFSLRHKILRESIKLADKVFVPSNFLYQQLVKHDFLNPNTSIMPLGIVNFEPIEKEINPNIRNIAYLGNINFIKGLDVLVKAFNLLNSQDIILNIYGNIQDHNYFNQVIDSSLKKEQIHFQGQYSHKELPLILSKTDIVVVPSRSESYSFVVRESLHAGVPVIASNIGGIPDVIKNGENGLLFEAGNSQDLISKLMLVIMNPKMLLNLRKNIKPVRTISEDATELDKIYSELIEK